MTNTTNHIWHPFTQMQLADAPIHISHGKDALLFDTDGNEYIDAISSWWVNIHGHANEAIAKAIAEQALQLEQVIFAGFIHTPAIQLSERIIQLLNNHFSKVFFSDNGSTAVEVAVKMALQYWHNKGVTGKTKILALENGYHGDTFGAMSVGGRSAFNAPFENHLFETIYIPTPTADNIDDCLKMIADAAKTGTVAGFIFEPLIQGSGGMIMYEPEHLEAMIREAKSHDIICIADEVMTGFGRTGKLFAIDYIDTKPDIICLSKGLTGGFMPMGLTVCTEDIYNAFLSDDRKKTLFHGHSYTANPLACAAALASIKLVNHDRKSDIIAIKLSHANFIHEIKDHPAIKDVRHRGTILAIEFKTPEDTSYFNSFRDRAYKYYISRGVLLRPLGNVVYIMPPYCITIEQLDKVYSVLKQSLTDLTTHTAQ
ncbi:MAG: adenosylmethionine--8-amino-7-oxononanoate transaminase [Bacteroidota bacterium]